MSSNSFENIARKTTQFLETRRPGITAGPLKSHAMKNCLWTNKKIDFRQIFSQITLRSQLSGDDGI
jgi:hypothetical protein